MNEPIIIQKAFSCNYKWSDYHGGTIVHAATAAEAKHQFNNMNEYGFKEVFNVRINRAPDHDLVAHPQRSNILDLLSKDQVAKMCHTIGNDFYKAEPYRNHYQSKPEPDMDDLVTKGLAVFQSHLNLPYYHLTQLGIEVIKSSKPVFRFAYEGVQLA